MDRYHPSHARVNRRGNPISRSELYARIVFPMKYREKSNKDRLEEAPSLDDTHQYPRARALRCWEISCSKMDHRHHLNPESALLPPPYRSHV